MGYLDELKRQAEAAKSQNTLDVGALERNALVTDAACQSAFRYFATLAQQLNILRPAAKVEYRLDANTGF